MEPTFNTSYYKRMIEGGVSFHNNHFVAALREDNLETVRFIFSRNPVLMGYDRYISLCCDHCSINCLRFLIEEVGVLVTDDIVAIACNPIKDDITCIEYFVSRGHMPNQEVLFDVIFRDHVNIFNYLLSLGMHLNDVLFEKAKRSESDEIFNRFVEQGYKVDPSEALQLFEAFSYCKPMTIDTIFMLEDRGYPLPPDIHQHIHRFDQLIALVDGQIGTEEEILSSFKRVVLIGGAPEEAPEEAADLMRYIDEKKYPNLTKEKLLATLN